MIMVQMFMPCQISKKSSFLFQVQLVEEKRIKKARKRREENLEREEI